MRRAILLLAVLAAGAGGCGRHCDQPGLALTWTFTDATGAPRSCVSSGTSYVRIFVDDVVVTDAGGNPIDFVCSDGPNVFIAGVASGTHKLQLDAYDGSNGLVYQYLQQSVGVAGCNATGVGVDLVAVTAPMNVVYSISNPGNTCPANSYVWYSIFDVTDNVQFATVDASHGPTSVPCSAELTFDNALFGQYRLDFIQIVVWGGPSVGYQSLYGDCTSRTFNHVAYGDGLTVPPLTTDNTFCQ